MSLKRIDKIINQLETGTYQWKPVRREYIKKKGGKGLRPLGLPGWNDKLLQEVVRTILEAYYEPQFSQYSHGYRPGRGCHTALDQIRQKWKGVKWFISGDIKGCFNNLDHDVLLDLIRQNMPDQHFLKLLKDMLEAGYLEDWKYHTAYSGVPQGSVISPILSNIILNELDKFVENELIPEYTRGKKRKLNPEYNAITKQLAKAKATKDIRAHKALTKKLRKTPSVKTDDDEFRRLYYCRYADDYLLGFAGPKEEAIEIQNRISEFLRSIKITTSKEKTLITHANSTPVRFLGYELSARKSNTKLSKDKNGRRKRRSINNSVRLSVPRSVAKERENRYKRNGKSIHRAELLHFSDYEIVKLYNVEFQGLANYYALAENISNRLQPVKYVYMQSLVKTLARKHQRKVGWVYSKYKTHFDTGTTGLMVTIQRKEPKQPLVAKFGAKPLCRDKTAILNDEIPKLYFGRNELVKRLLAQECELCDSNKQIEVHHIRKIADIKKRYQGKKHPPQWAVKMMKRHRKTLVVCKQCHNKIHSGIYDGPKLTQTDRRAEMLGN
jgi:group II intron reverse transcriptase/maturase